MLDSLFESLAECFVGSAAVRRAASCKRGQCAGEAFAVVEAGGSVVVGGQDEVVLSGGDAAESELAQPSEFLAGGCCEHLGLEGHAGAAIPGQVDDELGAHLRSAFNSHG